MKILFINASYKPNLVSGAERVVQTLAENLTALGHRCTVVTLQPIGTETASINGDVKVIYVPCVNIYRPFTGSEKSPIKKLIWHLVDSYNPMMRKILNRILKAESPDVINTHNLVGFSVSAYAAARQLGIPVVHTIHDPYLICARSTLFRAGRVCERRCMSCTLYSVPRIATSSRVGVAVGVSRYIIDRHKSLGCFRNAEKIVIQNGLLNEPKARPKALLGKPVRLGFLGQIRETKGLHLLIATLTRLRAGSLKLRIAGRGDASYEDELHKKTAQNADIEWLGYVKGEDFLRTIDVLVVPSLWNDTAPLVIYEAYAAGVPVIGSRRGGIPELIDEDTGWLFSPDKPNELGELLEYILQHPEDIKEKGRAAQMRAFASNAKVLVDQYLGVFEKAIFTKTKH